MTLASAGTARRSAPIVGRRAGVRAGPGRTSIWCRELEVFLHLSELGGHVGTVDYGGKPFLLVAGPAAKSWA